MYICGLRLNTRTPGDSPGNGGATPPGRSDLCAHPELSRGTGRAHHFNTEDMDKIDEAIQRSSTASSSAATFCGSWVAEYKEKQRQVNRLYKNLVLRSNRAAGHRFEKAIIRKLKEAGIEAHLTDETSGRIRGWDIIIDRLPRWVIQCKATHTEKDLESGFKLAQHFNQRYGRSYACIHSFRRIGRQPKIRVLFQESTRHSRRRYVSDGEMHEISLPEFICHLKDLILSRKRKHG